jgi:5-methylcytosine-specific restriction enzyme subunit McrC
MFCYAWNMFEEGRVLAAGVEVSAKLPDLVAYVMIGAVRRLLRRGLDQGYSERTESLTTPRGRIDIPASLPLRARRSPALACRIDQRSPDVPHNRVVKAALRRLLITVGMPAKLNSELAHLMPAFALVTDVPLRPAAFAAIQLYRHNAAYAFVLHLCRLVMEATIPDQTGRRSRFRDIGNDERTMRIVFEEFVRNLLDREQKAFKVSRPTLAWDTGSAPPSGMLPSMRLDVLLTSPGRIIIVDTKYTVASTQTYRDRESLRSGHLYQLFAYLRNAAATLGHADGVLLYPADGDARDYHDIVQGHAIRVATVDLSQEWSDIRKSILAITA